jgi:ribosomal protein L3 glutamine methyltransferase
MRSAEHRPAPNETLRSLLRKATRRLERARVSYGHGTTRSRDEAAWLVLHALGLPLGDKAPDLDRRLTPRQVQAAHALIEERIRSRKPAAYLTHEAWLGERRFYVDERVIVPRSYIAELLRDGLVPWLAPGAAVTQVLDLCTGSGCLAILTALEFPRARVDAADISRPALAVARRNVADYALQRRVRLIESDLFAGLTGRHYDLILSNPPYVTATAMRRLPAEYRSEPRLALAGGRDGLDFVRRILAEAPHHLTASGLLVVEVGHARPAVERAFPRLPFIWPETSGGDDCVFIIARNDLAAEMERAQSPRASRGGASPRPPATRSPARASTAAAARRRRSARGSDG